MAEEHSALWEEFTKNPHRHPNIPNVAFAGYRRGLRPPHLEVKANILDYGAFPDGSADASAAINRAIADVGPTGGAVLVPAGTYRLDDIVRLGYDNVVLQGVGSGQSVLLGNRSLDDIVGPNRSRYGGPASAWSWSGGCVWVCHRDRLSALTAAIRAGAWPKEGWTGNTGRDGEPLAALAVSATRGDRTVTVDTASRLTPGMGVLLQLHDTEDHTLLRHMCADVPGAAAYPWERHTKLLSYLPFTWPVRIEAIDGERVTLAQPLPLDTRPEWRPRLTSHAPAITGAGVEGLTIRMADKPSAAHLRDPGYNGLVFQCAWDCWAHDVTVLNSDNAILLVSAKNVTLSHTRVGGRARHHSYLCREQSHDNLIQDFVVEAPSEQQRECGSAEAVHHGINVEGLSAGNVWTRGHMESGTFDSHRGLPFAGVRTCITIHNDGRRGGGPDAGPIYGARFVNWNVEVTNSRARGIKLDEIAPFSATVGIPEVTESGQIDRPDFTGPLHARLEAYGTTDVIPENLYEAQRNLREEME